MFGYHPSTGGNWLRSDQDAIVRPTSRNTQLKGPCLTLNEAADHLINQLEAHRSQAKDLLLRAQVAQQRQYNKGRIPLELEVGDEVLINVNSMRLRDSWEGAGKKTPS